VNAPQPGPAARSSELNPALPQNLLRNLGAWSLVLLRSPRAKIPPPPGAASVVIALAVIAMVASMFFLDTAASGWARTLPRWFVDAFEQITNFGLSGWFLFPFGFILLYLAAVASATLPRLAQGVVAMLAARFGFLFLAIALPGLFVTIVKRLIGRARPYVGSHDDPFAYSPFVWRPEFASMPSGHATNAAAAAIAIGAIWPRARGVMWLYALIIMLSRVVVLAHHPSDVIAGALVGAVGALAVRRWFAARRLVFGAGDLRAFPGPSLERITTLARQVLTRP
jgi:membrane-associated phospholipid phosphatase